LKLIDLSYYYSFGYSDPLALLERQAPAIQYVDHLPKGCQAAVVKFLDYEGHLKKNGVDFYFFSGEASRFWVPQKAHRLLRDLDPDVVILHGFLFPWQVISLRKALGRRVKLLVQHHADHPGRLWWRALQKRADACTDGYLFSAPELATPFLKKGIINSPAKVFVAPPGSTTFTLKNQAAARQATGVQGKPAFIWVGRLDANKDSLTALEAFYHYSLQHPAARLYMIYQTETMLPQVQNFIRKYSLGEQVILVGKRPYEEMQDWYNSADYYLSTSYTESYGFSLVEAMACGCTPVVTNIPSFRAITGMYHQAHHFAPGDAQGLYEQLSTLPPATPASREAAARYFREHLSYTAMAQAIYSVCQQLTGIEVHELAG
jgi:glycosyltransferase involved in cell wall biosynthesis